MQIEEHEVHFAMLEVLKGGFAVTGFIHVVPRAAEVVGECEPFNGGIVTEEKSRSEQVSRSTT
jgi:hypothetical protein